MTVDNPRVCGDVDPGSAGRIERDLAAYARERCGRSDSDISDAIASLIVRGLIRDRGRRRGGQIVWVPTAETIW
jgi:hypothetical protein